MYLSICENSNILSVFLLVKEILNIFSIIVPIILIIMVAIDLSKIVLGKTELLPQVTKSIVNKMIAAVAVFFVPTLVNLLSSMLGTVSYSATACWENATTSTIAEYKAVEEANKLLEQEELNKEKAAAEEERERVEAIREEVRKENEEKAEEAKKESSSSSLTGTVENGIVYYYQCDYKSYSYGSISGATICSHGCGPTSAAVVASTFLGASGRTPVDTTRWICAHGGCYSSGTSWTGVTSYLKNQGLTVSEQYSWSSSNSNMLQQKLATGKYLAIVLVHESTGSCPFTNGGHYFVLVGVENGEYKIAQVSNRNQTAQTWPAASFNLCSNVTFYLISK